MSAFPQISSSVAVRGRSRGWAALALGLGLGVLGTACVTPPPPETYRGRLLEKRVVKTETVGRLAAELAPAVEGRLRLALTGADLVTVHEQPVYETVQEFKAENETDRTRIRRELVPGKLIEGAVEQRHEKRAAGPLADADVTVNGQPFRTGPDGLLTDNQELILRLLDAPKSTEVTLTVVHAKRGQAIVRLARADVLQALGVNVDNRRPAGQDGLQVTLTWEPREPRAGDGLRGTVQVRNAGPKFVACVETRTVSRLAWLDGRSFYIGGLEPGQARSFSRAFAVPAGQAPGECFGILGVWDLLGAVSDRNVPISLAVQPR